MAVSLPLPLSSPGLWNNAGEELMGLREQEG